MRGPRHSKHSQHPKNPKHRRGEKGRAAIQAFKPRTLRATVDKNRKGFGFLIFSDKQMDDVFIPPREAEALFHGDRVEVTINGRGEILSIEVLEHRFRELVGRFSPHFGKTGAGPSSGWVVYERKRAREEVFVPKMGFKANAGDWVRAKLEFHESGRFRVTAEILEVYGDALPASADIGMIAAEYNLVEEHSPEAEAEARAFKLEWDPKTREDLRNVPFITIDGETARDFDDAVYVERLKSGHRLWVAIADVSHYVTPESALDEEALSRGTSVYFPERAFHMLPSALSTNLCSLRPNEPRLALVARMDFDHRGKRTNTQVMEAVIESRRRATYDQIEEERGKFGSSPSWEYAAHFELYRVLKKYRHDRGSIDFDLPEAEVRVDDVGEPVSIINRSRHDAHRLIEEFMIAANEAVTVWMMERQWPFVYRTHDEPSAQALERFESLAATVGVQIHLGSEGVSPKILSDVVRRFEGHPAQDLLNMALLRSMKQAIYSATHGIHYGLASEAYTHFTSPIRRYPDLVVHRLIRWALRVERKLEKSLREHERQDLERELEEICEHCSYRERLAADADREATRLKQVRYMHRHLGDEFDGKIIGMGEAGLFVQIPEPYVEGLIPKDSMTDDLYEFNEERMVFAGRRKKRTFRIGHAVRIKVIRADMDRRQIDFALVSGGGEHETSESTTVHRDKRRNFREKSTDRQNQPRGRRSKRMRS